MVLGSPVFALSQAANGEQRIALAPGWNLISSNRLPQFANLTTILTDINNSIAVLTGTGSAYYTSSRNLAGNWDCNSAYSVYMNQADTLNVYGDTLALPRSVQLFAGKNHVGYPKRTASSVISTFASVNENIICISDGEGHFYIPAMGIGTLTELLPGKGYIVHVSGNCTLVFQ